MKKNRVFKNCLLCIKSSRIPNAVTKKAIQDTKDGKGLVKAKDAHDLFKKLGI